MDLSPGQYHQVFAKVILNCMHPLHGEAQSNMSTPVGKSVSWWSALCDVRFRSIGSAKIGHELCKPFHLLAVIKELGGTIVPAASAADGAIQSSDHLKIYEKLVI